VLAVGDAEFQKKCLGKMGDITAKDGRTVLFVSHNLAAVKSLCNRGILLENGQVLYDGGIEENISKYYMPNYENSKNNFLGIYSFENHKDKKNSYGILKAEMYCNEQLTDTIYTGSKFEIKLFFEAERDFFEAEIGFVIKDSEQVSYIGLNNKHLGKSILIKKGKGSAEICIEDFPLYAIGDYWINLYFGDQGPNYECLENAIKVKIIGEDIFNSGIKLDMAWNKMVHRKISIKKT
jgi:lipopolysaccharide transport system ATP-binding protein